MIFIFMFLFLYVIFRNTFVTTYLSLVKQLPEFIHLLPTFITIIFFLLSQVMRYMNIILSYIAIETDQLKCSSIHKYYNVAALKFIAINDRKLILILCECVYALPVHFEILKTLSLWNHILLVSMNWPWIDRIIFFFHSVCKPISGDKKHKNLKHLFKYSINIRNIQHSLHFIAKEMLFLLV